MNTLISWFTRNSVAANLLMLAIMLWGMTAFGKIIVEAHPSTPMDLVTVKVFFRGAAPKDVEESVLVRIEEAIQDLDGIKSINSQATESNGEVNIEVGENHDPRKLLEDVKARVDTIDNFPEGMKKPVVAIAQRQWEVISVIVAADAPERELRLLGERVRDDLVALPGVSQVQLTAVRPYEVAIEVSEKDLQRYSLTFDAIAQAINRSSLNLPAGSIKSTNGEIMLRTMGQAYDREAFANIVLRPRDDGSQLRLGDIANVVDGFEEEPLQTAYNHKRCVKVEVYRSGNQSVLDIASKVKNYIAENRDRMPPGVELTYWRDQAESIKIRLDSLLNSAIQSMLLVFIVLSLFLRMSIAFWVSAGIPVSILGAFAMMPILGISINYTSVGAFILVLGLVVDDAIVTGESIYARIKQNLDKNGTVAAIKGTQEVSVPVTFGMLTTVVAFFGLLMNSAGELGKNLNVVPMIVISVLLVSWVESKFILPAHLKHLSFSTGHDSNAFGRWQTRFADGLEQAIARFYTPFLLKVLEYRYLALSVLFTLAMVLVSLVASGRIGFNFYPNAPSDSVRATLTMPIGTPFDVTRRHAETMIEAAEKLQRKYLEPVTNKSIIIAIYSSAGSTGGNSKPQSHIAQVMFQVTPPEIRSIKVSSQELAAEWRSLIGTIPGVEKLSFVGEIRRGNGMPVDVELRGQNFQLLNDVAEKLQTHLASYPGVSEITNSHEAGKEELQLSIRPEAELLGVTLDDLARQVQQAFLGLEAQRVQRGRDDVRIVVRYPVAERSSLAELKMMKIRTPSGIEVPFADVADIRMQRSAAVIHRADRFRTLNVTADVDFKTVGMESLKQDVDEWLQDLLSAHPDVNYRWRGQAQEQAESLTNVVSGTSLALLGIYAMLAIPFRSYTQPFIVMSVIPFALLGAVLGHMVLGINLTLNSILGMVALMGVAVNDSLVMVDFINRRKLAGEDIGYAISQAGSIRFRPIMLTSLTTFVGLCPLMFTDNVQAQFLVPMAASLGFGVLFATFITLFFVPMNYMILEDIGGWLHKSFREKIA